MTSEGRPMLSDFSISCALVESGTVSGTRSLRGTMRWMAAELIVPTSSSEADQPLMAETVNYTPRKQMYGPLEW